MPTDLQIKDAPDEIVARLRERAARNERPLERELLAIVEAAVEQSQPARAVDVPSEVRALGMTRAAEAADIVRADRDER